jgi:hypothetical protein
MRELLPFDGLSIAQHPRLSKCRRVNGTTLIGYSDSAIFKSCKVGPFTRMACSVAVDSLIVDQLKAERRYPETTLTAIVLSTINSTNLGHFKMSALGKNSNINRIAV